MVLAEISNLKIALMARFVALYIALSENFHLILSKGLVPTKLFYAVFNCIVQ
jgi:hypothetical protein